MALVAKLRSDLTYGIGGILQQTISILDNYFIYNVEREGMTEPSAQVLLLLRRGWLTFKPEELDDLLCYPGLHDGDLHLTHVDL